MSKNQTGTLLISEEEKEKQARKHINTSANEEFDKSCKPFLADIKKRTLQGVFIYDYPILGNEREKGIWENRIMTTDEASFKDTSDPVEITKSNIHTISALNSWLPVKTTKVRDFNGRAKKQAVICKVCKDLVVTALEEGYKVFFVTKCIYVKKEYQIQEEHVNQFHDLSFIRIVSKK